MTGAVPSLKRSHAGTKRRRDPSLAVSEDEEERERRRQDRNLREQQRSRRITEQISQLRNVLLQAGVPCKPDKNSTLISVADYITQLQNRSNLLDSEHKKLLDTIARTNEMVNNQYYQATADGSSVTSAATPTPVSNDLLSEANMTNSPLEDENIVFVQGLDYKSVFKRCGIALAVASIDGRFIDCNSEFVTLSGYSRKELLPGEELSKTEVNSGEAPSVAQQRIRRASS
jgi:PAS domain-containing protein